MKVSLAILLFITAIAWVFINEASSKGVIAPIWGMLAGMPFGLVVGINTCLFK